MTIRLEKWRDAAATMNQTYPPLTEPSCELAESMYYTLLGAQPSSLRGQVQIRMLTLELAESHVASSRLNKLLLEQGETITNAKGETKSNPLCSAQHQRAMQISSLATKLRLTPSEAQQDKFEVSLQNTLRNGSPIAAPKTTKSKTDQPNWVELLEESNG